MSIGSFALELLIGSGKLRVYWRDRQRGSARLTNGGRSHDGASSHRKEADSKNILRHACDLMTEVRSRGRRKISP